METSSRSVPALTKRPSEDMVNCESLVKSGAGGWNSVSGLRSLSEKALAMSSTSSLQEIFLMASRMRATFSRTAVSWLLISSRDSEVCEASFSTFSIRLRNSLREELSEKAWLSSTESS